MNGAEIEAALTTLGATLAEQGESASYLVIGGSSLILLGLVDRATVDVDVVAEVGPFGYAAIDRLPDTILDAVAVVARSLGLGDERWLNAGPAGMIVPDLPKGIEDRVTIRRYDNLVLHLAGRTDLICFKLYAAVDMSPGSRHLDDIRALHATRAELIAAARWTRLQDDSAAFLVNLRATLAELDAEADDVDL